MLPRLLSVLAVLLLGLAPAASVNAGSPDWPATLTIVTASPGGTYHAYGAGLATMLSRVLEMPVTERTTEGPVQNIQLIDAGEAQIGFVTMGVAMQAWNGSADWTKGKQYREIRALFPMYDTPFHFVVPTDAAIRSLRDMAGKRVGVGPEGGTAGTYVPKIFAALDIPITPVFGGWADLATQFTAGSLDVLVPAGGVPFPAVAELEAKKAVRFVNVSEDDILKARLVIPELERSVIAAGSYPSLLAGYQTFGLYNFAVADKDLPLDLVYRIVDAVFANRAEMIEIHPAAVATVPANFVYNTFLPYHPGALRYFGNIGASGIVRAD